MDKLVIVPSGHCNTIPHTTPAIIAEHTQVSLSVLEALYKSHHADFCKHEDAPSKRCYRYCDQTMPEQLNEAQAMLLIALLKNTVPVQAVRIALIEQFNVANKALAMRREQRADYYIARTERSTLLSERGISNSVRPRFTEFAYILAFDKDSRTVRRENRVPAYDRIVDYMSMDDLFALTSAEEELSELLRAGKSYEQIRTIVMPQAEPEPAIEQAESTTPDSVGHSEAKKPYDMRALSDAAAMWLRDLLGSAG
ncbi:hypothetical protein LJC34_01910 [Oscillospiraceae bacterium OttesenSCG-928-G22]|nr:hypothetical protein [Oscillospiraceae bacterium OttesenSCG-928-G22]